MGALARLALIADELGETGLAETYRQTLKSAMEPWLSGKDYDIKQNDEDHHMKKC